MSKPRLKQKHNNLSLYCLYCWQFVLLPLFVILLSAYTYPLFLFHYTSTIPECLTSIVNFENELLEIEIEGNSLLNVNESKENIVSEIETLQIGIRCLSSQVEDFVRSYNSYNIDDVYDLTEQFYGLEDLYSHLFENLNDRTEAIDLIVWRNLWANNHLQLLYFDAEVEFLKHHGLNLSSYSQDKLEESFCEENVTEALRIMILIKDIAVEHQESDTLLQKGMDQIGDELFSNYPMWTRIFHVMRNAESLQEKTFCMFKETVGKTYYRIRSSLARINALTNELNKKRTELMLLLDRLSKFHPEMQDKLRKLGSTLTQNLNNRQVEI